MQYRSGKGFTGGAQLGILLALTGAGMLATGVAQMLIAFLAVPPGTPLDTMDKAIIKAFQDPANVGYARFMQVTGTLLLFFIPAVLFSGVTNGWNRIWLGFSRYAGIWQFALGIAIIFLAGIAASSMEDVSRMIFARFPSIDKLALDLENAYNESVRIIGAIRSWPELLLAIVIMAFLPALFEETFFRGALQNLLQRWWQSPFWAIVASSLVFSLVHFSFYLFLSRFVLGLALGMMFHLTRNIRVSIVAHFMNNAIAVVQMFIMSKDKIGAGSEGSSAGYEIWLALPALACIFFLFRSLDRISAKRRISIAEAEIRATSDFSQS